MVATIVDKNNETNEKFTGKLAILVIMVTWLIIPKILRLKSL